MIAEHWARRGAAASHTLAWLAVGGLCSFAHAADGSRFVPQESVVVSLPVFCVSIVATASFTWAVAKWDARRSKEVGQLRDEVARLTRMIAERGRSEDRP